ncbi:hypothetical protein B0T19DRAFT_405384 [Cercophora scortea]|uniref:Uncharacterized protein n=1 Tax=Cercophora scortea TaxID=314031 RepID=A0AAE0I3E2_9PEZI|nr:hypothetical protein B0T19DRAFT_405384 [Cercophora scortea]
MAVTVIESSLTPFPRELALEKSTLIIPSSTDSKPSYSRSPSFGSDDESAGIDYLPGYPTVGLQTPDVHAFMRRELNTPIIDELYNILWIFSIKSGRNVDPLHRLRIKGREIIPTEEAKLHLVWTKGRIYIKTLPIYLLNHTVWESFLGHETQDPPDAGTTKHHSAGGSGFNRGVALGFLRSYSILIQSPLDFSLAKEAHLIPEDADVDWIRWAKFIAHFRGIQDGQVSPRYKYGQIRLNRLNWMLRITQPKSSRSTWYYQRNTWSVGAMITSSFPILLFAFASLSLVLSSMQVALTVAPENLAFSGVDARGVEHLQRGFFVFSITTVACAALTWMYLVFVPVTIFVVHICWALKNKGVANSNSRIKRSAIYEFQAVNV